MATTALNRPFSIIAGDKRIWFGLTSLGTDSEVEILFPGLDPESLIFVSAFALANSGDLAVSLKSGYSFTIISSNANDRRFVWLDIQNNYC